jgi:NitT/TauT family transport system ATP-binding protein
MITRFNAVSYSYPGPRSRPVLRDVTFELAEGKTISILGRNGSGKSTLLSLAAGLIEPTGGSVVSPAQQGIRLPMVFQDYRASLFPRLSAVDNIALPWILLGEPRAAARRAARAMIDEAGLAFDADKSPDSLSGGQAQLVSLLRALMLKSPLVLLDEPSSALDIFASIDLALVSSRLLHDRGSAALFVSHSIDEAVLVADYVAVLAGAPGCIAGIESTDLPYPRDRTLLHSRAFAGARDKVLKLIVR